ncbi:hypothetical protein [Paraburkholderia sp.]|uniref:hypothetical protein n=1 Tax=Paraburkholderia sp. TaxID=1926495 RepID=UPI0039E36C2B
MASKLPDDLEKLIDSSPIWEGLINSTRLGETIPLVTCSRRGGMSVMTDMMIPGYRSTEASAFPGGHKAYVDHLLQQQGKAPKYGYRPGRPSRITIYTHTPLNPDEMEDRMAKDPVEHDPQLKELVDKYEEAFAQNPQTFALASPQKLITQKGKDFRHTAFIGGEEFTPVSARLGAKGQTLILFKPVDPSDFEFLEVPETACRKTFGAHFASYLRETLGDVAEDVAELEKERRQKAERERNAEKFETYGDLGFGSW